jgi:hypothetical protein
LKVAAAVEKATNARRSPEHILESDR